MHTSFPKCKDPQGAEQIRQLLDTRRALSSSFILENEELLRIRSEKKIGKGEWKCIISLFFSSTSLTIDSPLEIRREKHTTYQRFSHYFPFFFE